MVPPFPDPPPWAKELVDQIPMNQYGTASANGTATGGYRDQAKAHSVISRASTSLDGEKCLLEKQWGAIWNHIKPGAEDTPAGPVPVNENFGMPVTSADVRPASKSSGPIISRFAENMTEKIMKDVTETLMSRPRTPSSSDLEEAKNGQRAREYREHIKAYIRTSSQDLQISSYYGVPVRVKKSSNNNLLSALKRRFSSSTLPETDPSSGGGLCTQSDTSLLRLFSSGSTGPKTTSSSHSSQVSKEHVLMDPVKKVSYGVIRNALETTLTHLERKGISDVEANMENDRALIQSVLGGVGPTGNKPTSGGQNQLPAALPVEIPKPRRSHSSRVLTAVTSDMAQRLTKEEIDVITKQTVDKVFTPDLLDKVATAITKHTDRCMDSFAEEIISSLYDIIYKHFADDLDKRSKDHCVIDIEDDVPGTSTAFPQQTNAQRVQAERKFRETVMPSLVKHVTFLLEQHVEDSEDLELKLKLRTAAGQYIETIVSNAVLQTHVDLTKEKAAICDKNNESNNNNNMNSSPSGNKEGSNIDLSGWFKKQRVNITDTCTTEGEDANQAILKDMIDTLYVVVQERLKQLYMDEIGRTSKEDMDAVILEAQRKFKEEMMPSLVERVSSLLRQGPEVAQCDLNLVMIRYADPYIDTIVTNAMVESRDGDDRENSTLIPNQNNNNNDGNDKPMPQDNPRAAAEMPGSFDRAVELNQTSILETLLRRMQEKLGYMDASELSRHLGPCSRKICCVMCKSKAIKEITKDVLSEAATKYLVDRVLVYAEQNLARCCDQLDLNLAKIHNSDVLVSIGKSLLEGKNSEAHSRILEMASTELKRTALTKAIEQVSDEFLKGKIFLDHDRDLQKLLIKLNAEAKKTIEEAVIRKTQGKAQGQVRETSELLRKKKVVIILSTCACKACKYM